MADTNTPNSGRRSSRTLTEKGLRAEQVGDQERADELIAEAERIDAQEVETVLRERQPVPVSPKSK